MPLWPGRKLNTILRMVVQMSIRSIRESWRRRKHISVWNWGSRRMRWTIAELSNKVWKKMRMIKNKRSAPAWFGGNNPSKMKWFEVGFHFYMRTHCFNFLERKNKNKAQDMKQNRSVKRTLTLLMFVRMNCFSFNLAAFLQSNSEMNAPSPSFLVSISAKDLKV